MSKILDTRSVHGVKTPQEHAKKHTDYINKLKRDGYEDRLTEETITTPVEARIDANRWLFDCLCGSGVAAHPGWPESRCYGCGRIYTHVVFPSNREAIEAELMKQSHEPMREWSPGETIADIRAHQADLTAIRQAQLANRGRR